MCIDVFAGYTFDFKHVLFISFILFTLASSVYALFENTLSHKIKFIKTCTVILVIPFFFQIFFIYANGEILILKTFSTLFLYMITISLLTRLFHIAFYRSKNDEADDDKSPIISDIYGLYYIITMTLIFIVSHILHSCNYAFIHAFGYGSYYTMYLMVSLGLLLFYKNNNKSILKSLFVTYLAFLLLGFSLSYGIYRHEDNIKEQMISEKLECKTTFKDNTSIPEVLIPISEVNQPKLHIIQNKSYRDSIFIQVFCYIFSFLSQEKSTPCRIYDNKDLKGSYMINKVC